MGLDEPFCAVETGGLRESREICAEFWLLAVACDEDNVVLLTFTYPSADILLRGFAIGLVLAEAEAASRELPLPALSAAAYCPWTISLYDVFEDDIEDD